MIVRAILLLINVNFARPAPRCQWVDVGNPEITPSKASREFRNSLFPSPLPSHGETNLKDDVDG